MLTFAVVYGAFLAGVVAGAVVFGFAGYKAGRKSERGRRLKFTRPLSSRVRRR